MPVPAWNQVEDEGFALFALFAQDNSEVFYPSGSEVHTTNRQQVRIVFQLLNCLFWVFRGAWVAAFSKASEDLSTSSSSKTAAASVFKGIAALETSSKAGDLQSAKKSFVSTVSAFGSWADEAGISASLKGL